MEAKVFLKKLYALVAAEGDDDEDEPATPAKKPKKPAKAKPDADEDDDADDEGESFDDDDEDDEDEAKEEVKLTRDDVRKAMVAYQKKTTPEKARKLLKTFGANTLGELEEAQYAKVIAKTKA